MEAVAARVSQFLMSSFKSGSGTSIVATKEDDVTREVDIAAEEMAYRMLREGFKEGGVLYAEERGSTGGETSGTSSSSTRWTGLSTTRRVSLSSRYRWRRGGTKRALFQTWNTP